MSDEVTREAVAEEMHRIYHDPAHPHHEGYKKGLPQSVAYVEGLYGRIPGGGEKVELATEVITVTGDPTKPPGQAAEAASADTPSAWIQEVQRELGGDFESAKERVTALTDTLFGGDGAAEQQVIEGLLAAGMTEREIFDMARKVSA